MFFTEIVYIHNKPLIFTNDTQRYRQDHPDTSSYFTLTGVAMEKILLARQRLADNTTPGGIIEAESMEAVHHCLEKAFATIEAAGGVVSNQEGAVLMIYRRGKWDLPKGKRDDDEAIEHCARREVMEETGLPELVLGDKITETYHVYIQDGQELLKTTHWFHMKADKALELTPQEEEDILEVRWVAEKKLGKYLGQSYPAIKELLLKAGKKWEE
jgi:8-oxo-dGTP pyrophosphatase MutT (NUDIX family)